MRDFEPKSDISPIETTIDKRIEEIIPLGEIVAKDVFDKRTAELKQQIGNINMVMGGVIIVFFIAFLAFVLDAWKFHTDTYKDFSITLSEQQRMLESYSNKELSISIQELRHEITELKK